MTSLLGMALVGSAGDIQAQQQSTGPGSKTYYYSRPALRTPGVVPSTAPPQLPEISNPPVNPGLDPQKNTINPVSMQIPQQNQDIYAPEIQDYDILLEPPGPERLFRLESEESLRQRIIQEARSSKKLERVAFPTYPPLSTKTYQVRRDWKPRAEIVEPNYVCFCRQDFAQNNFERYGWDVGPVTPFLCAGKFYWDVFFLPYHLGSEPFRHYDCNAGLCLPGDPTPFYLYPPKLSATGLAAQAGAMTGAFYIFP